MKERDVEVEVADWPLFQKTVNIQKIRKIGYIM